MVIQPEDWVHPGAYFRAWAMVERFLAMYNCGLLTTAQGLSAIVSTCVALLGLVKLCDGLRQVSQPAHEQAGRRGYRVLSHHTLHASYLCVEAKRMASGLSVSCQDTVRMMADRMAADATKIEPVGTDDKFRIARLIRGWTVGSVSRMEPLFAKHLWQRAGIEHGDSINFALAKEEILSSWAGRAPCYAPGDKLTVSALFANFVLVSLLVKEKGSEWLRCFVGELYDRGWEIENEGLDVGIYLDTFENYVVFPASIGMDQGEREEANQRGWLFGRYSGCIPISAFWDFLERIGYDSATKEYLQGAEQQLWENSVEFDGDVFMSTEGPIYLDTQPLQPHLETCPRCSGEKFTRVGSIWRSAVREIGKRRFWTVGERDANKTARKERGTCLCPRRSRGAANGPKIRVPLSYLPQSRRRKGVSGMAAGTWPAMDGCAGR